MANLERGFRRLTWVVSVVLAIPFVGLGVYGLTEKDTAFAFGLILIGTGIFVLSWATFFVLRWVAGGFRDGRRRARDSPDDDDDSDSDDGDDDDEEEEEEEEEETVVWWRRLLRPFARLFVFDYFARAHCRYPAIHKDSWGIIHVVCGAPPIEAIEVRSLQAAMDQLKSGNEGVGAILPRILSAMMDESGLVPMCGVHRDVVYGEIDKMFDKASEEEREAFKEWVKTRK